MPPAAKQHNTSETKKAIRSSLSVWFVIPFLQEETQRVSNAVNNKMGSGEALPERSDRERDVTGRGDNPPPYEAFCHVAVASPAVVSQCGRNLLFMR